MAKPASGEQRSSFSITNWSESRLLGFSAAASAALWAMIVFVL
ncbi:MAG: hypothetical protein AAFW46_07105 [Pseudomonadota bacterium]